MQKYLKKAFSKKSHCGFSLIELVIGILITKVIGAAIMEGTAYYRHKMLSINIKEKAFGAIKKLYQLLKSKIVAGEWQVDENVS